MTTSREIEQFIMKSFMKQGMEQHWYDIDESVTDCPDFLLVSNKDSSKKKRIGVDIATIAYE